MIRFAVLSFPGTNCESETVRAFRRAGMEAEVVLWNDPGLKDGSRCEEFDGYCLAGGFSYEDRGRSGVVAAQHPVMETIRKEAEKGKVILGICNGAQMLVETGLIPGYDNHDLAASLAWNEMVRDGKVVDTGFRNQWCYLRNSASRNRSAFSDVDETMLIPIAHGEGRFVFRDPETLKALKENGQVLFQYCDAEGKVSAGYPTTPNGSTDAIAALGNPAGNVMAMMPHPERDPMGNGEVIFNSIRRWIEESKTSEYKPLGTHETHEDIREPESYDLEFFVRLIIVDNAERTIETTVRKKGFDIRLKRFGYWGVKLNAGSDPEEAALKILHSGELANLNKEWVTVRIGEKFYGYSRENGLQPDDFSLGRYLVVCDQKNFLGESKKQAVNLHEGDLIDEVRDGVLWQVHNADEQKLYEIVRTKILYNPNAMRVMMP